MCINDDVVVTNKAFLGDDFTDFDSLQFWVKATITEALNMSFVVDEIRILK